MTQPEDAVAHDEGDLEQYAGEPVDDGWAEPTAAGPAADPEPEDVD